MEEDAEALPLLAEAGVVQTYSLLVDSRHEKGRLDDSVASVLREIEADFEVEQEGIRSMILTP